MSVILSGWLMVAITLFVTKLNVQAQNNGDVRLANNIRFAIDTLRGRLEIFIDGKWGTICGTNGTDFKAVADTACRQLGFAEASISGFGTVTQLGYPIAPKSTPIHLGSINCPSTSFDEMCSPRYYEHILRCEVDFQVDKSIFTHNNDVGVDCFSAMILSNSYESKVDLLLMKGQQHFFNLSRSSGILGIFLDKSEKPGVVCGEDFDKSAADTACRQLGYTNANYFNTSLHSEKATFWDAGLDCKSQSHSCLNKCFTKTPSNHTTCTKLVFLSCEFDLSRKTTESPGSPRLCDAALDDRCKPHHHSEEPHTNVVAIIVSVFVVLVIIATCTTCITLLVCCLVPGCLIHRKRSGYKSVS